MRLSYGNKGFTYLLTYVDPVVSITIITVIQILICLCVNIFIDIDV